MEFLEFKDLLFKKAIENGFNECEIYYRNGDNISISAYDGEVEKYDISKSFGLSFRGKINNKMGYSYTEVMDESTIDILINNAKNSANIIENNDTQFIYEGDKKYSSVNTYSRELENINPKKMIDLVLELEKETKSYDKVINLKGCKISYSSSDYGIYNTKGLELTNKKNILTAYVASVVKDEVGKNDGLGYIVASSINEVIPKKIAKQSVNEAVSKLGGKSIASGTYKTIIYNKAMASILKTFACNFSADRVQKGLSLLKDKEGEIIASNLVTIIDDPLFDNGLSSTPFDDEGVSTYTKEIISNGKLITFLHNLKTANKAGVKSTGNGFKSSYASSISVSESNLYLKGGNKSLEELMEHINEGIMITDLAGLHSGANTISGDFSLAAKGFYVKDGKKSFPIEQITLSGNYFDLLKNIVEVGDDIIFPMSNVGSPSIIVKGLSIAGE